MSNIFSRYHILWLVIFSGAVLCIGDIFSPWLHIILASYIFLYVFVILPQFLISTLFKQSWSLIDTFFSGLIFFFFIFTPLFYLSERIGITQLRILDILLVFLTFIFFSYLTDFLRDKSPLVNLTSGTRGIWFKKRENILILGTLLFFLLIHGIYFYFYQFLPEWDGYTDITAIEKNVLTESFHQNYRAFFQASSSILSLLFAITPYILFFSFFIPVQATLLLVLFQFFKLYSIHDFRIQTLFYLSALSIPVLAMETDMVRPQNILILFVPIILYLLTLYEKHNRQALFVPLFIITAGGIWYHEFFWFFFGTLLVAISMHFIFKRNLYEKPLYLWGFILIVLSGIATLFFFSLTLQYFSLNILLAVSDTSEWRWWFLDSYSNSGMSNEVGWSGLQGMLQYYGYYVSPVIVGLFIFLLSQWKNIPQKIALSLYSIYTLAFLLICLVFAEVLPRLNSPFLPERYWLFFDIVFLFFTLSVVAENRLFLKLKLPTLIFLWSCCLIGLGASVYIASAKKSLTTNDEYQAALWLQTSTEPNAIIFSQPGNLPLIKNFAKREILIPANDFFLSDTYISPTNKNQEEKLIRILKRLELHENKEALPLIAHFRKMLAEQRSLENRPLYILYSEQKFSTLYNNRDWYLKQNFKNAHLEKFDTVLEEVYSLHGITIWKIR